MKAAKGGLNIRGKHQGGIDMNNLNDVDMSGNQRSLDMSGHSSFHTQAGNETKEEKTDGKHGKTEIESNFEQIDNERKMAESLQNDDEKGQGARGRGRPHALAPPQTLVHSVSKSPMDRVRKNRLRKSAERRSKDRKRLSNSKNPFAHRRTRPTSAHGARRVTGRRRSSMGASNWRGAGGAGGMSTLNVPTAAGSGRDGTHAGDRSGSTESSASSGNLADDEKGGNPDALAAGADGEDEEWESSGQEAETPLARRWRKDGFSTSSGSGPSGLRSSARSSSGSGTGSSASATPLPAEFVGAMARVDVKVAGHGGPVDDSPMKPAGQTSLDKLDEADADDPSMSSMANKARTMFAANNPRSTLPLSPLALSRERVEELGNEELAGLVEDIVLGHAAEYAMLPECETVLRDVFRKTAKLRDGGILMHRLVCEVEDSLLCFCESTTGAHFLKMLLADLAEEDAVNRWRILAAIEKDLVPISRSNTGAHLLSEVFLNANGQESDRLLKRIARDADELAKFNLGCFLIRSIILDGTSIQRNRLIEALPDLTREEEYPDGHRVIAAIRERQADEGSEALPAWAKEDYTGQDPGSEKHKD